MSAIIYKSIVLEKIAGFPNNTDWIRKGKQIGDYSLHIVDKSTIFINMEKSEWKLKDGLPIPDKLHLENIEVDEDKEEFKGFIKFHGNPVSRNDAKTDSWELNFCYGKALKTRKISCSKRYFDGDGNELKKARHNNWILERLYDESAFFNGECIIYTVYLLNININLRTLQKIRKYRKH